MKYVLRGQIVEDHLPGGQYFSLSFLPATRSWTLDLVHCLLCEKLNGFRCSKNWWVWLRCPLMDPPGHTTQISITVATSHVDMLYSCSKKCRPPSKQLHFHMRPCYRFIRKRLDHITSVSLILGV